MSSRVSPIVLRFAVRSHLTGLPEGRIIVRTRSGAGSAIVNAIQRHSLPQSRRRTVTALLIVIRKTAASPNA
jgi:hypothetical protein